MEICYRLDGLPLAIELAAARVPLLGLSGVRQRLNERFRILTSGARTALRRQQTLHETLDWSYGLLNADERAIFRRLGVFVGSFGMDVAQRVLADARLDDWAVLEHLGALANKSLVIAEPTEPRRYRLLESARAYALEKLLEAGELESTRAHHAHALLWAFEASTLQRWTLTRQARLRRYLPDLDNCRAALAWAAQGTAEFHIELVGASAWIWEGAGQRVEGMQHCACAIARVDSTTPAALEARLQYEWCGLDERPGTSKRAAADRAVLLYRSMADRAALYSALGRLAINASVSGDASAGELAIHEMVELFDPAWPALARWDLLHAHRKVAEMLRRYDDVEALACEETELAAATGDSSMTLSAMVALEQCAANRGDYAEALARGRELVARFPQDRFPDQLQPFLCNLAAAFIMVGDLDEGLVMARKAAIADSRKGRLWADLDCFALLACERGRANDAALVIGRSEVANAWRGGFREPVSQRAHDDVMLLLRGAFSPTDLAALLDRGASMSDEGAARIALAD